MTAVERAYKVMVTNKKTLTVKQIAAFGVANPYDVVYKLRRAGVNVVANSVKGITKYSVATKKR